MPRFVLACLSALVLPVSLLLVGCNGSGGGASPTAGPSTATATATATAQPGAGDDITANQSAVDVVKELGPSVVHILSEAATLDVFGQVTPTKGVGTGFVLDREGHIVTNNHVVTIDSGQPAQKVTVTLSDGRQFQAETIGRDAPTDLAVLKVDADGLTPVTLGSSAGLQVGESVVAIGNALDLAGGPTVTQGVVSAKGRLIQENDVTIPDAIQTDASINPGNSGGPLVNMRGQVVGITTAVIRGEAEGIGLAISIDSAEPIVQELIDSGRVDRGFLGVSIVEITPSLAESFGLAVDHGIGLQTVEAGGPADGAGLRRGDIIVGLAGDEIRNSGDLFKALTAHRAGEKVQVEFYRDGRLERAEVTLG
ncbi:MAG TPA: trypsin-like peptidase domain-containing protein [Dehalococcoidia bacterium]|nr:trypsin-like peptidase domain-containing protein [Dehalococcoidia bacterium]